MIDDSSQNATNKPCDNKSTTSKPTTDPVTCVNVSKLESIQGVFKFMLKRISDLENNSDARFNSISAENETLKTKSKQNENLILKLQKTVNLQQEHIKFVGKDNSVSSLKSTNTDQFIIIDARLNAIENAASRATQRSAFTEMNSLTGFPKSLKNEIIEQDIFPLRKSLLSIEKSHRELHDNVLQFKKDFGAKLDAKITRIDISNGERFQTERHTSEIENTGLSEKLDQVKIDVKSLSENFTKFVTQINNQFGNEAMEYCLVSGSEKFVYKAPKFFERFNECLIQWIRQYSSKIDKQLAESLKVYQTASQISNNQNVLSSQMQAFQRMSGNMRPNLAANQTPMIATQQFIQQNIQTGFAHGPPPMQPHPNLVRMQHPVMNRNFNQNYRHPAQQNIQHNIQQNIHQNVQQNVQQNIHRNIHQNISQNPSIRARESSQNYQKTTQNNAANNSKKQNRKISQKPQQNGPHSAPNPLNIEIEIKSKNHLNKIPKINAPVNEFKFPDPRPSSESSVPKKIVNKIPILQPITFSLFDDLDDFKENDTKILETEQSGDAKTIETKLSEAKISESKSDQRQQGPSNTDLVKAILNKSGEKKSWSLSEEYLPPTPERKD